MNAIIQGFQFAIPAALFIYLYCRTHSSFSDQKHKLDGRGMRQYIRELCLQTPTDTACCGGNSSETKKLFFLDGKIRSIRSSKFYWLDITITGSLMLLLLPMHIFLGPPALAIVGGCYFVLCIAEWKTNELTRHGPEQFPLLLFFMTVVYLMDHFLKGYFGCALFFILLAVNWAKSLTNTVTISEEQKHLIIFALKEEKG